VVIVVQLLAAGQQAFGVVTIPFLTEHSRRENRGELFSVQYATTTITSVGAAILGGLILLVHPLNTEAAYALGNYYQEKNDPVKARQFFLKALPLAEKLLKLRPQDQMYQQVLGEIRALSTSRPKPSQ
jgi:MFS family permease